jgi:hypothetical protein
VVRTVAGGDTYPMGRIESALVGGDACEVLNDLLEEAGNAHPSVANLESPLVCRETPIVRDRRCWAQTWNPLSRC